MHTWCGLFVQRVLREVQERYADELGVVSGESTRNTPSSMSASRKIFLVVPGLVVLEQGISVAAHGAIGVGARSVGCDCNRPGTLAIVLEQGIVEAAGGILSGDLLSRAATSRGVPGWRPTASDLPSPRQELGRAPATGAPGRTGYIGREVEKCVLSESGAPLRRSAEQAAHGLGRHDGVSVVIAAVLQSGLQRELACAHMCGWDMPRQSAKTFLRDREPGLPG